jgi:hypothetical protein
MKQNKNVMKKNYKKDTITFDLELGSFNEYEDIISIIQQQIGHQLYKWDKATNEIEKGLTKLLEEKGQLTGREITDYCEGHNTNPTLWILRRQPEYEKIQYNIELLKKLQYSYDLYNYNCSTIEELHSNGAGLEYGLNWRP